MAFIALSITIPISGVWAALDIVSHLASSGTKKTFSIIYASISSSNPSFSSTSSLYLLSNAAEIYLKNISPTITFLYSAAGICPHNTHAASHISFSNPIFTLLFPATVIPHFHSYIYYN